MPKQPSSLLLFYHQRILKPQLLQVHDQSSTYLPFLSSPTTMSKYDTKNSTLVWKAPSSNLQHQFYISPHSSKKKKPTHLRPMTKKHIQHISCANTVHSWTRCSNKTKRCTTYVISVKRHFWGERSSTTPSPIATVGLPILTSLNLHRWQETPH